MKKITESKEEVRQQLLDLMKKNPLNSIPGGSTTGSTTGSKTPNREEFNNFFGKMEDLYKSDDFDLAETFEKLVEKYPHTPSMEKKPLPVTKGEIKDIYTSIQTEFGGATYGFSGSMSDPATVADLQKLFRKVMENYEHSTETFELEPSQKTALSALFKKLAGHY